MDEMLDRIVECIGPKHGAIKDLAEYLGVTPNVITNLKNGSSKSYRKYTHELSDYFNVSVDYLLGNEGTPATQETDELYELLEDVRRNPELRAMFSITKKAPGQESKILNRGLSSYIIRFCQAVSQPD